MLRLHQARYSCHQHNSSERWQPRTGHIQCWDYTKPDTAVTNTTAVRGGNPELGIFRTGKQVNGRGTPPSHQIIQRNGKKKRNPLMHSTAEWCGEVFVHDQPPPPPTPTPTHPQHPLPTKLSMQEEDKSTYASWKMWKGFCLWPTPEPPTPFPPNYPMKQQEEEKSTYWLTHSTVEWCGEVFIHDQPHPPPSPPPPPSHKIIHLKRREIHLLIYAL